MATRMNGSGRKKGRKSVSSLGKLRFPKPPCTPEVPKPPPPPSPPGSGCSVGTGLKARRAIIRRFP